MCLRQKMKKLKISSKKVYMIRQESDLEQMSQQWLILGCIAGNMPLWEQECLLGRSITGKKKNHSFLPVSRLGWGNKAADVKAIVSSTWRQKASPDNVGTTAGRHFCRLACWSTDSNTLKQTTSRLHTDGKQRWRRRSRTNPVLRMNSLR